MHLHVPALVLVLIAASGCGDVNTGGEAGAPTGMQASEMTGLNEMTGGSGVTGSSGATIEGPLSTGTVLSGGPPAHLENEDTLPVCSGPDLGRANDVRDCPCDLGAAA